jgi:hypothetical protein
VPVLKKNRIAYDTLVAQIRKDEKGDKAGAYEAVKQKYLEQVLIDEFKLVYDKKRNPEGIVKELFYWQNAKQQKAAIERIKADARDEGDNDTDGAVRVAMNAAAENKIHPRYRDPPGKSAKSGYLLLNNTVFTCEKEADVFSLLDYVAEFSKGYEHGIKATDMKSRVFEATHIAMVARSAQMLKIISKERNVSPDAHTSAKEKYVNALNNYHAALRQLKNAAGDVSQKEYTFMTDSLSDLNTRMKKLGYEHKEIEGKYDLVRTFEK